MTRFTSILSGLALVAALGANGAMAASATGTAAGAPAKVAKVHSPESIECSKQADAKGLHGKERKAFRSTCISQAKAAAKSTAAKKPATAPAADKKS